MDSTVILGAAILAVLSILASKVSDRFGVPALLLFLALGMLAGSDGIGGIYFDDPQLTRFVGVLSLAFILFSGGLDTNWRAVRPVLRDGLILSTVGVLITAGAVTALAVWVLDLSPWQAMLLGAIVSSTDAAAVFTVLRSRGLGLKGSLKPLLELESGSNDPMAVFLTVTLIQVLSQPGGGWSAGIIFDFLQQMLVGAVIGYLLGQLTLLLVNRLNLGYAGLYPVLTLSMVLLIYGLADLAGGSPFLAVYLAGIVVGNHEFVHKRSLIRFHDGLAWLVQIAMFLTLGLLVFPSRLPAVMGSGLLIAGGLILIARPAGVFLSLLFSMYSINERLFAAWVGLRGAAPIVLATFPLVAGISQADLVFNVVFFVVLTSVLLQGTTVGLAARVLQVAEPQAIRRLYPLEYNPIEGLKSELIELTVPEYSPSVGRAIFELGLPDELLVVLIARGEEFLVPSGGTRLAPGDALLILCDRRMLEETSLRLGWRIVEK